MNAQLFLFYCFAFFAVFGACFVVTAKNPVRAVLSLVFTFVCMAANWILIESEVLGIVLVLVYVGAVMVLFLFVVMMIHLESPMKQNFIRYWPIGLLLSILFLGILFIAVSPKYLTHTSTHFEPYPADFVHVKALGELLYTEYLLPFEISGVILLLAMIAAIGLAYRGQHQSKPQKPGQQVQVRKEDRLKIIKMTPERGDV